MIMYKTKSDLDCMFNTISSWRENQGDANLWQNFLFRYNTDSYVLIGSLAKSKRQKKYFEIEYVLNIEMV